MDKRLKSLRLKIYQQIYAWALDRWNKELDMDDFKRPNPRLSNHALLRYAERFDGFDIEKAKANILSDEAVEHIKYIGGNGKFSINGIFYIVRDGNIITVARAQGNKMFLSYQPVDDDSERGRRWTF